MRKAASTRAIVITLLSAVAATTANAGNYLDEMAKRDAQLALLRKEIELRDARAALAGGGLGLPTVQSLSGFDDNLSATLKYPNGRKLVVRRGDTLPGGVEVKRITRAGVVVRQSQQRGDGGSPTGWEAARCGDPPPNSATYCSP